MVSPTDGRTSSDTLKQYRLAHLYQFVACAHDAIVHTDTHESDRCVKLYAIPKFDARTDITRAQLPVYNQDLDFFHGGSYLAMFAVYPPSDRLAWPSLYDQEQCIVACTHTDTAFSMLHCSDCCGDQHPLFAFDFIDKQPADHGRQYSYSGKQFSMHAPYLSYARYPAHMLMSSRNSDGNIKRKCAGAAHGWIPTGECASIKPSTTATHGWIPSGECAGATAHASSD